MESFLMASRVVVPMALTMGVGVLLRVIGIVDRDTMKKVDVITYKVLSSVLIFYNIYYTDFSEISHPAYLLYGAFGLTVMFVVALYLPYRWIKERPTAAAFGQGIFRANYIIFGAAVATSIYGPGNIGLVMMMGALTLPMINAMSVIILEVGLQGKSVTVKSLAMPVITNPIVLSTIAGLIINVLGIKIPGLVMEVVEDLANMTTPMSFLSIGVSLSIQAFTKNKVLIAAISMRLIIFPLVLVTGAVLLGFRGIELCSLLVLFAAPAAVNSYPTAVAMGADGEFAGQMVAVSTICCLPTFFLWTLVLNTFGLM